MKRPSEKISDGLFVDMSVKNGLDECFFCLMRKIIMEQKKG
jgi:hypothetical protein